MSRQLPAHPNLEYLKKQAKELLRERQPQHPQWTLADAQHALARDYGFESWPKLKTFGYRVAVRWEGPRVLEVVTTHAGLEARVATYEVSLEGRTLLVSTTQQRLVFRRA